MDRRALLVVVAGAFALGAIIWAVSRPDGAGPQAGTVAARAGAASTKTPPGPAPVAAAPARPVPAPPPPTREAMLRQVEDRFLADPLAPEWAQRNEKVITGFLAAPNLRGLNLVVPLGQRVECHSTMCRIALLFPDVDAAAQVHERLVLSIGESLPMAQAFTVNHEDGRIELVVFAGDERAMSR